jgi:hypothetical protein
MNREFKLRVIPQTTNARQRKILRYQAIKSKLACCFKTEIYNYSFDTRKKMWNENVQQKFWQENSNLPFAVPGNVKLKLPISACRLYGRPLDLWWGKGRKSEKYWACPKLMKKYRARQICKILQQIYYKSSGENIVRSRWGQKKSRNRRLSPPRIKWSFP